MRTSFILSLLALAALAIPTQSEAYYRHVLIGPQASPEVHNNVPAYLANVDRSDWPEWIGRLGSLYYDLNEVTTSNSDVMFGQILRDVLAAQPQYSSEQIAAIRNGGWPDWISPPWWVRAYLPQ